MQKMYENNIASKFVRALLLTMVVAFASFSNANAQVTVSGDGSSGSPYANLAAAISAVNTAAAANATPNLLSQPTTITLLTGNPQTAPSGGYVITATGNATNTLTITGAGSGSIVTAFGGQATGNINDAIFKFVGSDNVTITGFQMQENSANTVTGVATNNMTEFGIAFYAATTGTNGCRNNVISNNTISLNNSNINAIGILSTAVFSSAASASAGAAPSAVTPAVGGDNSNNTVRGNTISNVAQGIWVITGNATTTFAETGWIIGQSGAGNTISFLDNTNPTSYNTTFGAVATHGGINLRNAIGTVSFNTLNSGTNATLATIIGTGSTSTFSGANGIVFSASTVPATGVTFANTASNNTISMQVNSGSNANFNAIDLGYGTATGTFVTSNNTITFNCNTTTTFTNTNFGIKANYTNLNNTANSNNINYVHTHAPVLATQTNPSPFTGISLSGTSSGSINGNSNTITATQQITNGTTITGAIISGALAGVVASASVVTNSNVNSNTVTLNQTIACSGTTAGGSITGAVTGVSNSGTTGAATASYYANYNTVTINQRVNSTATGAAANVLSASGAAIIGVSCGTPGSNVVANNTNTQLLGNTVLITRGGTQSGTTATTTYSTGTINGLHTPASYAVNYTVGSNTINTDKNLVQIREDNVSGGLSTTYGAAVVNYTYLYGGFNTTTNVNVLGNSVNNGSTLATTTGSYQRSTGTTYGIYPYGLNPTAISNTSNNIINIDRSVASSSGTGILYAIYNYALGNAPTHNTSNNTVNVGTSGTGSNYGIALYGSNNATIINNVYTNNVTMTGAGTNVFGIGFPSWNVGAIYNIGSTTSGTGNSISITTSGVSPTIAGISSNTSHVTVSIVNNTISTLSATATATSAPIIRGINLSGSTTTNNVFGNTITGISTGAGSGSATIVGLDISAGTTNNVYKNNIYNLGTSNTGTSTLISLLRISAGTTNNIYNNLLSQQNGLTGVTSVTPQTATGGDNVRGINISTVTATSANNIYNNTVYLNQTSTGGANFGSTTLYAAASATAGSSTLDLRNNILINLSTKTGTGLVIGHKRSAAATFGNFATTSNNNLWFQGTPSAATLAYSDFTNTDQNVTGASSYQTRVSPRESASITGESSYDYSAITGTTQFFNNLTPTSSSFLKPLDGSTTLTTQVEAGASQSSLVTDDYVGVSRGTTPDMGAYEFVGQSPAPSLTLSTPSNQCTTGANTTVTATVNTPTGTITGTTITYNNGTAAGPTAMTLVSGSGTGPYVFTFDIPAGTAGSSVTWSVTATNSLPLSKSVSGTSYIYLPLTGSTPGAVASSSAICTGSSATLTATLKGPQTLPTGHCLAYNTSTTAITSTVYGFTNFTTTGGSTNINNTVGTGLAAIPVGGAVGSTTYAVGNYTSQVVSQNPGGTINFTATANGSTYGWNIFVDWNRDGVFGAGEQVYTPTGSYVGSISGSFVVPLNAIAGKTKMRVLNDYNATSPTICQQTTATVVHEYTFEVLPVISSTSWNLTSSSTGKNTVGYVGATNPITVSPINNNAGSAKDSVVYTPTITANGCAASPSPTVFVNVNSRPADPQVDGTNSTQCGTPRFVATTTASTPTFRFYTVASGGSPIATQSSGTYDYLTYTANVTNTLYVEVTDGVTGCTSARIQMDVFVNVAPTITVTPNITTCQNRIETLSVTSALSSYNSYTWTPTTNLFTDASATTPYTGGNASTVYFKRPTVGTQVITVNGTDVGGSECSNNASVTLTVTANPTVTNVSATPATVCSGSNVTLVGQTNVITAGTVTIGAGATTSTLAAANPFYGGYGGCKTQFIMRASELTAAGISAGNITSLGVDVSALGTTNPLLGVAIDMAHTTLTALTTNIETTTTNVYPSSNFTPVLNVNTFTFATPFNWNGTDNLLISFCYSNNTTSNSGPTLKVDALSFTSSNVRYVDSRTAAEVCGYSGSALPSGWNGSATTGTSRPKFVFGAQTAGFGAGALNWSWNATSPSTPAVTSTYPTGNSGIAKPAFAGAFGSTGSITYAVTGANTTAPFCSSTVNTSAVAVRAVTPAPTDASNLNQCGTPTYTISTSVTGTPTIKWYAVGATTPLVGGSGTSLSYTYTTYPGPGNNTLEVTVTDPVTGCESPRTSITITVVNPPVLTVNQTGSISSCVNRIETFSVTNTPSNFTSYAFAPVTNLYTNAAATVPYTAASGATTVYYKRSTVSTGETITLSAVNGACSDAKTVTYAVSANPVISAVTATPTTVCSGADVTLSGQSVISNDGTAAVGTQTTTSITGGPYRQGAAAANKAQYLFTAAELNAAGIVTGNITALAFNVTSNGSGVIPNLSIAMAPTSLTALTSTYQTAVGTTVYTAATYTTTVGLNTHTFSTPFNWNGTSNILITVCHDYISSSSSTVSMVSATNAVVYSNTGTSGSICASQLTGTIGTIKPVISFTGKVGTNVANTYSWNWSANTTPVQNGTGNPATIAPNNTTSSNINVIFTARATEVATSCFTDLATASVVVRSLPAQPVSSSAANQCGAPTFSVTNVSGMTYKWYAAASGGSAISGATSNSYSPATYTVGGATNSYWVTATNSIGCESQRTQVDVVVNTPPSIATQSSATTVCSGTIITLEVTPATAGNFGTYVWSPATNLFTDAAATTSYTGQSLSTVYFKRTTTSDLSGLVYTVTGTDNTSTPACINSATVSLNVNAIPNFISTTATPSSVCSGTSVNLNAVTNGIVTGSTYIGTGTIAYSDYSAPFYSAWSNKKLQYLIKASQLSAFGLTAGNITGIGFPTTSGTVSNKDYSIKIANTTATDLSAAFATGTFTTVYTATAGQAQTANTDNDMTFTTPFNWNGTSDIIIELCWGDATTTATLSSTSLGYTTTYVACRAQYNTASTSGTSVCATGGSTTVTYSYLPNIKLFGQAIQNNSGSFLWSWSNGTSTVGTPNAATSVIPTNSGLTASTVTYCATATNPSTSCAMTSCAPTVTVNPNPTVASTNTGTTVCGTPTYTATSAYGGVTYNWFTTATGGTALQSSTNANYTYSSYTSSATGTINTLYVSVSLNGCESARTAVSITSTSAPALALSTASSVNSCVNRIETITASGTGYTNYIWYPTTNLYTDAAATISYTGGNSATVYYKNSSTNTGELITCAADGGGCINTATSTFVVNGNPIITQALVSPATVCAGSTISFTGASIPAVNGNSATIGTATTNLSGSNGNPLRSGNGTGNQLRTQIIYTAASLSAAGLTTGNITALSFVNNQSGSASTGVINNLSIGVASTSLTALTSTIQTISTTNVFSAASYDCSTGGTGGGSGLFTFNFATPFFWNGTSNIFIDVCQTNATLGTSYVDGYVTTNIECTQIASATTGCSGVGTNSTTTTKPTIIFRGQVGSNFTSGLTWTWDNGTSIVGTSSSTTTATAVVGTTSYNVTALNATTSCSSSTSTNTIVVNTLPGSPSSTTTSNQCGTPTYSVANVSGMAYKWYTTSTGGTAISGATSNTYVLNSYTAGGVNSLWVSATRVSTGCESPRTQIDVTVANPPALTLSTSASVNTCQNRIQTISLSSAASSFSNYAYSPVTNLYIDAGATTAYTVASGATTVYYKNPAVNASDVITLTGTNTSSPFCVNTASVTFNVRPNPVVDTMKVTPTTSTLCSGTTVALNGISNGSVAGNRTIGTAGTSLGSGTTQMGLTPFSSYYGSQHSQYLYTAANLTARGIRAGNITAIAFDVMTKNSNTFSAGGSYVYNGYTVKLANVTDASLSAILSPTLTTVYTDNLVTTTGSNLLSFGTGGAASSFNWDGVSNILVDVCFSNTSYSTAGNDQVKATVTSPAYNATYGHYQDGTSLCGTTGGTAVSSTSLPDITFYGQVYGNAASSFTWSWTNTIGSTIPNGPSTTNVPSTTTGANLSYTGTVLNAATSCSTLVTTPVQTLFAAGVTPTVTISTATTTVCSGNEVTFTANAYTGSLAPTYTWRNGTTVVGTNSATYIAPPNSLATGNQISCTVATNNPCSTPTAVTSNAITVTVNPSPASGTITNGYNPIVGSAITYCNFGNQFGLYPSKLGGTWSSSNPSVVAVALSASGSNGEIKTLSNGNAIISYSILATNGTGCITTQNINMTVAKHASPAAVTGTDSVCIGNSVVLSNATPGGVWSSTTPNSVNVSPTGVVTGLNANAAANVSYTTTNLNGCKAVSSYTVKVRAIPAVPTIGYALGSINPQLGATGGRFCTNKTFTLVGIPAGGVWSSTNAAYATVTPSGTVTLGSTPGSGGITYRFTNGSGCQSSRTISGTTMVCPGSKGVLSGTLTEADNSVSALYPNPATNVVNIRMDMLVGKADIFIVDVLGKKVKAQSLSLGNNEIDITGLAKGLYLVNIITNKGKETQKLVVE